MAAKDLKGELQELGFSEYEARAYVMLLERGPLPGYQLARATGIPRPNIYPVLDRLQSRSAAGRVEVKGGTRYVALPAEAMLDRLGHEMASRLDRAREALRDLPEVRPPELVWNIQGQVAVIERARSMIDQAESRIIAGVWSDEARTLLQAMADAESRGVSVTTLCMEGCPEECGGCRGEVYRYRVSPETERRWLVLSVDERELLVAEAEEGGLAAATTALPALVAMGSQYLLNTIATAEIVRSLGPRLVHSLDRRAMAAIQGAGLSTAGSSWYDRLLGIIKRAPA